MGYYRNTIEDLYSGHFKNSYGVEGMLITGRSDRKKIIDVSDEIKNHVLEDVKKAYYKYNGMSGGNDAEEEAYARGLNEYYKTLDIDDRVPAAWTLGQLHLELSGAVVNAIREKVPGWEAGQQIPSGMLDEIFSGKTIEAIMTRKPGVSEEAKDSREDRLDLGQSESSQSAPAEEEKKSGKVAFNQGKRARQLAAAKTPSQVQIVISLLKQDLSDCEAGLESGMCDENEVEKVKAMMAKAMERLSEVSGKEQEEEGPDTFLINMLM